MKTESPTQRERSWSVERLEALAKLCDEFELAWKNGAQPKAEDFLRSQPEADRQLMLSRILGLEMELRQRYGHQLTIDQWRMRFPDQEALVHDLFAVVQADLAPVASSNIPERLGRYRVTRRIGTGTFGIVYAAYDDELSRQVAIKVPHRKWLSRKDGVDSYVAEARVVASLDHPNIVPVYDVGRTDEGLFLVVSKFIDGTNLADRLRRGRPSITEIVSLITSIADALHYAHLRGLVHRDIKPANVLLDQSGKAYLADFGLVLREEDFGKGPTFAGTPQYMSPEQARFEGHRVDGRSDIFSLGIVFYELLTGRRPFRGETWEILLDQIVSVDPRPPRQFDDAIPRELERICLRALAKLAAQRYSIAQDMSDDLRHWDQGDGGSQPTHHVVPAADGPAPGADARRPAADSQAIIRVVPKGLRSFDAGDADFFYHMLPGPRDREGIPETLRFWARHLRPVDSDRGLSVGVIYGPSGCGKSSFVKAGLLPHMPAYLTTIYVEAAGDETESRLLGRLQHKIPSLPNDLTECIATLRRGGTDHTVLIVIDQFEQWLNAHRGDDDAELIRALRQCDGRHVQCLLLVRDDFWMPLTRFMRLLEIPINEGETVAAIDLFDSRHAKRVLTMLGRAYGALPELAALAPEQDRFVDQAVAGLSNDGKIIPVRLALFSEMVKNRNWTPATLKALGGMEGVAVTFLDEAFAGAAAPQSHKAHAAGARAVLRALLPEPGTTIKGNRRSYQDLLVASGYADRPRDFDELMTILGRELRLISLSDSDGAEMGSTDQRLAAPTDQFYQLTHDYLVPALWEWLVREQKQTRRGRAELLLAERSSMYEQKPSHRSLPGFFEWLRIRALTRKVLWTPGQQAMMHRAARRHLTRAAGLAAAASVIVGLVVWDRRYNAAEHLQSTLLTAQPEDVTGIVAQMAPYRSTVNPMLVESLQKIDDSTKRTRLRLALLPVDSSQAEPLFADMMRAKPEDFAAIRLGLVPHFGNLAGRLDKELDSSNADRPRRFRAACALAEFAPDDPRWESLAKPVVESLLAENALVIHYWQDALAKAGRHLLRPLTEVIQQDDLSPEKRQIVTAIYQGYAQGQPAGIQVLEDQLEQLKPSLADRKGAGAQGYASLAALTAALGDGEKVWPLLKYSPDPTVRSHLIERLAATGVPISEIAKQINRKPELSIKRALILALGQFDITLADKNEIDAVMQDLLQLFKTDPDPGVHAACDWILRKWGNHDQIGQATKSLAASEIPNDRGWFIDQRNQEFVIIRGPIDLPRAHDIDLPRASDDDPIETINYSYVISAKEVTAANFIELLPIYYTAEQSKSLSGQQPANLVRWHAAAEYCNKLNEIMGIPETENCYVPSTKDAKGQQMKIAEGWQTRSGFRLPTELEWEIACRAGTITPFSCGYADDKLLANFAVFQFRPNLQSTLSSLPVGTLKPNDWGLFDMHGNVTEWCHLPFKIKKVANATAKDFEAIGLPWAMRGGAFDYIAGALRSDNTTGNPQTIKGAQFGFRVVRRLKSTGKD